MKSTINFCLCLVCILLNSCSSDEPVAPSARDEFIDKIATTWTASGESQILLDGLDVTRLLEEFEIIINKDLSYTTNSNLVDDMTTVEKLPWPTSGFFTVNDAFNQLIRNDGLVISTALTANNQLILTFQFTDAYDDSNGGRTKSIIGNWSMLLEQM